MKNYSGIKVFAPATINGLSDLGIDVLGIALEKVGDEIIVKHNDEQGISIKEVHGGKGLVSKDVQENPACIAARLLLKHLGKEDEGISMEIYKRMPINSSLGSNESSAVAGMFAINELLKRPLTKEEMLPLLLQMNLDATHITASLFGGVRLFEHKGEKTYRISCPIGFTFNVISIENNPFEVTSSSFQPEKRLAELVLSMYSSNFNLLKSTLESSSIENNLSSVLDITIPKGILSCFIRENNIIYLSMNSLVADEFTKDLRTILDGKKLKYKIYDSSILNEGVYKL